MRKALYPSQLKCRSTTRLKVIISWLRVSEIEGEVTAQTTLHLGSTNIQLQLIYTNVKVAATN